MNIQSLKIFVIFLWILIVKFHRRHYRTSLFDQVFEAVLRWIKHDLPARVPELPELMVKVRLPLLTPQYLSDNVATEDIIKNSLQCRYIQCAGVC